MLENGEKSSYIVECWNELGVKTSNFLEERSLRAGKSYTTLKFSMSHDPTAFSLIKAFSPQ